MQKNQKKKKPDLSSKPAKYFFGRQKGLKKNVAALEAGYSPTVIRNPQVIEKSQDYKEVKEYYKDKLNKHISVDDIAREHAKVILQDLELGPKMGAIKIAIDKIEPEAPKGDDDDKVLIILK